jgi:AcrR family transcriptional regulator
MVLYGTIVKGLVSMPRKSKIAAGSGRRPAPERPVRERILSAAFAAFQERGFSEATTSEIATLAKASKRELYACFENKQEMLIAGIAEHAKRIRPPLDLPAPASREALLTTLTAFGTATLRGVCEPGVLAVYRLAIGESERSPKVAKALDSAGREANRAALAAFLAKALANDLLAHDDPAAMADFFRALLWGDVLIRVLLRVANAPSLEEMERRAHDASRALLASFPGASR